jgi:site-specific recombinase XerD
MPIPDYQSIMLPLLELAADRQEHVFRDSINALADRFKLTEAERRQPMPSGGQALLDNRVGWARTYLVKSRLLEAPRRGVFRITERGIEVLRERPKRIDVRFLKRFPELIDFLAPKTKPDDNGHDPDLVETKTPEEVLESGYQSLRQALASELLARVKACSPEKWLPAFGHRKRSSIKTQEIAAQLASWRADGLAESTVNHRLSAISDLYRVLAGKKKRAYDFYNPARDCERFTEPKRIPPARPWSEIEKLLDHLETRKDVTAIRLRCLATSGMRPCQLRRLQRKQIDLENRRLTIPDAKNGNPPILPLGDRALAAFAALVQISREPDKELRERLQQHRKESKKGRLPEHVYHVWGHADFSESAIWKSLERACKKAGIPRLYPYQLRHSLATHLLEQGASSRHLQAWLGHSSIRLVERYAQVTTASLERFGI